MRDKVLLDLGYTLPHVAHDRDYVVIGGSTEDMLLEGFQQVGSSFPVFLHPDTKEEYALARRETKVGNRHTDFTFDFAPDINLEEDALRRDFTVNALYFDEEHGELLDPTGYGLRDCKDKILRHIDHGGSSFNEDPLRIIRCARFAAQLEFNVADETTELIKDMVKKDVLQYLSRERIDNEFTRAMNAEHDSASFLKHLYQWGALDKLYPELARLASCQENPKYHQASTTWGHMLAALDAARAQGSVVKTAIAYHDIYKPIAYAQRLEQGQHVPHDDDYALEYLIKYLSQRKFSSRTKKLCKIAVTHHMRMRYLFDGISIKKWVDMIASITNGFRKDYKQQLLDLLEVCKADDTSDRTGNCFSASTGKDRWKIMRICALQTFGVCSKIQARNIPDYQNLKADQLKTKLRQTRIEATSKQVDFFKQTKDLSPYKDRSF